MLKLGLAYKQDLRQGAHRRALILVGDTIWRNRRWRFLPVPLAFVTRSDFIFKCPADISVTKTVSKHSRRGRPSLNLIVGTQAAVWAEGVRDAFRLTFAEIERELSPKRYRRREHGGYKQPNAWPKYASGERAPLPPEAGDRSPVVRARARYPHTFKNYSTCVWQLVYHPDHPPPKRLKLTAGLAWSVRSKLPAQDIDSINAYGIVLTPEGLAHVSQIMHIDAFGLLLMQWRNRPESTPTVDQIFYVRLWLAHAFEELPAFRAARRKIIELMETNVPELGPLEGRYGLDLKKSLEQKMADATWGPLHAGISITLDSSDLLGLLAM